MEHQADSIQAQFDQLKHTFQQLNSSFFEQQMLHENKERELINRISDERKFGKENEIELNQLRVHNLDLNNRVNALETELTSIKFRADDDISKRDIEIDNLKKLNAQIKHKLDKTATCFENKNLKERLASMEKEKELDKASISHYLDEINRLKVENMSVASFKQNLKELVLNSPNNFATLSNFSIDNVKQDESESKLFYNDENKNSHVKKEVMQRSFSIDSFHSNGSFHSKSQNSDTSMSDLNVKIEYKSENRDRLFSGERPLKRAVFEDRAFVDDGNSGNNRRQVRLQQRLGSNYKGRHFNPNYKPNGVRYGRILKNVGYHAYKR